MFFSTINLFGQVRNFNDVPSEILEQLNKMGVDNSSITNSYESTYLNIIFEKFRKDFDFKDKRIGFLTGSTGKTISNKKKYFDLEKYRLTHKLSPNNGILYIFDAVQKEEAGGYDAAIVYWSKFVIPIEKIIKRLKNKR
jgi:hypothetical protein